MQILSAVLMLAGYFLIGLAAFRITKGLTGLFPYASPSRWSWTKYLPLVGFALALMVAGESLLLLLPGLAIIAGSALWLNYCVRRQISG